MYSSCKSINDFKNFINRYEAGTRRASAEYRMIQLCKTVSDYNTYLSCCPNGLYSDKAKKNIDDLNWSECKSYFDFKNYIKKFPSGQYVKTAENIIDKKERQFLYIIIFVSAIVINIISGCNYSNNFWEGFSISLLVEGGLFVIYLLYLTFKFIRDQYEEGSNWTKAAIISILSLLVCGSAGLFSFYNFGVFWTGFLVPLEIVGGLLAFFLCSSLVMAIIYGIKCLIEYGIVYVLFLILLLGLFGFLILFGIVSI